MRSDPSVRRSAAIPPRASRVAYNETGRFIIGDERYEVGECPLWVERVNLSDIAESASVSRSRTSPAQLVMTFGPTQSLRSGEITRLLRTSFPEAILFGCSTGTTVEDRSLSDTNTVAVAIGFETSWARVATERIADMSDSYRAGQAIGLELGGEQLVGVLVLSDGLAVNGSALVNGLKNTLPEHVKISGGLAGDGAQFADTLVTVGDLAESGLIAAVGLYGPSLRMTHEAAGGWDEFGPVRIITRSDDSILYELDGKPALDLYETYLGDEAAALPASALLYPLKIWDPASPDDEVVRTVLSVDHARRSMKFAGDIPQGWKARLMRGSFERLIDSAAEAADSAKSQMENQTSYDGLCLIVSCVGRRLLMGQQTEEEIDVVYSSIGGSFPIVGFYSYGEILANSKTGPSGLHNQTITLTMISEVA